MVQIDPVQLLRQLVRIPSVNPMEQRPSEPPGMAGRSTGPADAHQEDIFSEARLTDFLQQFCQQVGLETVRQPVLPGRENLIVRLPGYPPPEQGGQILLWDAHQDTVPPGQMPEPFSARIHQGRLYGRGACDVKGGLAAMLAALVRLAGQSMAGPTGSALAGTALGQSSSGAAETASVQTSSGAAGSALAHQRSGRVSPENGSARPEDQSSFASPAFGQKTHRSGAEPARRPTVYLAATVDEEHGMSGVRAVCRLWQEGAGGFLPRRPDAAIVAEPTDLQVVVAHKGVVRWRCHTVGQASHSSRPQEGVNAIYLMAEVLQALQQYAHQIVAHLGWHPLCGSASLSVGRIYGGQSVNIVPDRCTIEIDRRLLPDESPQKAWDHCLQYLFGCFSQPDRLEQEPPWPIIPGLSDQANNELAVKLSALVAEVTSQSCQRIGADYATHAAFYAQAGVPTVVFGPGSIRQAHTADEWIALDQLHQAAEVFYRLVATWYSPG